MKKRRRLKTSSKPPNNGSKVIPKLLLKNLLNNRSKSKMYLIPSCKDCTKKIPKLLVNKCQEVCPEDFLEELLEVLKADKKGLKLMKSIDLIVYYKLYC